MEKKLIAPCGMNCGLCKFYLQGNEKCPGCRIESTIKPERSLKCSIKNCEHLAGTESGFCYSCSKYPCTRIKRLDKRYRTKYYMSMLDNLNYIAEHGTESFISFEKKQWTCTYCGGTICVHLGYCMTCKNSI
jgi:hypothetical protein